MDAEALFAALGDEMRNLGFHCAVATIDSAGERATIQFISLDTSFLKQFEALAGFPLKQHAVPRRYWPSDQILTARSPIWYEDPNTLLRGLFPDIPKLLADRISQIFRMDSVGQMCALPLLNGERLIGVMLIWGMALQPADSPALTIFASQVANILQNTTDYEQETQRADELARSNAMLLALSKVAACLDSTSELQQVFETLGNELEKAGLASMIGTLDETGQHLKIEYLSIQSEVVAISNRFKQLWPTEVIVPRRLWPSENAVVNRTPYWDPDPVSSYQKMFPYLPRWIFHRFSDIAGIHFDVPTCYLPLIHNDTVIGILSVWGPTLRTEDMQAFSVFSNQVAIALTNTKLYDRAQAEIKERTRVEAHIRGMLAEKDILLKEVHHCVKNNLQIISSLLNLQAGSIVDQHTIQALQDSRARVRSMALIHEKLYQSSSLVRIDFGEYIKSLATDLFRSYQRGLGNIRLIVQADPVELGLDQAIPCGLILNELVSNALKYAFPDGRTGTLHIELQQCPNHTLCLCVTDYGSGLPPDFDLQTTPTLGLQLVNSLVMQLDGQLEIESAPGTRFCITFHY